MKKSSFYNSLKFFAFSLAAAIYLVLGTAEVLLVSAEETTEQANQPAPAVEEQPKPPATTGGGTLITFEFPGLHDAIVEQGVGILETLKRDQRLWVRLWIGDTHPEKDAAIGGDRNAATIVFPSDLQKEEDADKEKIAEIIALFKNAWKGKKPTLKTPCVLELTISEEPNGEGKHLPLFCFCVKQRIGEIRVHPMVADGGAKHLTILAEVPNKALGECTSEFWDEFHTV